MLTDYRLSEIMNLKWEYVDLPGREFLLPDSQTCGKFVQIGQAVVDVLKNIPGVEVKPWVIVRTKPGARLSDPPAEGAPPRGSPGHPNPRPAPHIRLNGRRQCPRAPNDREAPRPYSGSDDRAQYASGGAAIS